MEDKTRALIVTGAVLLLILALIIAAIFYLIRFISGRNSSSTTGTQTRQINFSPSPSATTTTGGSTSTPTTGGGQTSGNNKTYNGGSFQLSYPKNWGLLTCSNSQNVEFDPYSSTDQLKVACDYAQKPITVMSGMTCSGNTTNVGGVEVVKSKRDLSKGVENSWCVKNSGLIITNRVSSQEGARGYGKDDFSKQIEEMISKLRVGGAS